MIKVFVFLSVIGLLIVAINGGVTIRKEKKLRQAAERETSRLLTELKIEKSRRER